MNKTFFAILIGLLTSLNFAAAFDARAGESVTIASDETVETDLYLAGDTVTVDGTVLGDVVAAARIVTIRGSVEGDVIAAARTVEILGQVQDDARITGASLVLGPAARIGGHVVAGGFHLEIEEGSSVASDLAFAGRSFRHHGDIEGNATISAQAIRLFGDIAGDAELWLDRGEELEDLNVGVRFDAPGVMQVFEGFDAFGGAPFLAEGLRIADDAQIGGDLRLVAEADPEVPSNTVAGEITRETPEAAAADTGESPFWQTLRRFATLAVLGVLGLALVPAVVQGAGRRIRERTWASLGWGLVALIAVPVAAMVLVAIFGLAAWVFDLILLEGLAAAMVAVAATVAAAIIALYVLVLLYVVQLAAGYAGGRWLLERFAADLAQNRWAALLFGLLVIVILAAIPVVGQIVSILVALFGAGALVMVARGRRGSVAAT